MQRVAGRMTLALLRGFNLLMLAGIICMACVGQAYAESDESAQLAVGTAPVVQKGIAADATDKDETARKLANVNLKIRAKLQYDGWQPAVKSGKVSGTKTAKGFRKMRIKLTGLKGVSGSILYKTYVPGAGWSHIAKNGKASGSDKRAITAARIYLKGTVAKYYDVYYRTYFKGYGWLGWAKNNQMSGTMDAFGYVSALQIKLVKKTAKFTGKMTTPFVKNRWQAIEHKYREKKQVNEILEVKYQGNSRARVVLRQKNKSNKWKTVLSCTGYVGSRGIGQAREGISRTPSGDFEITSAFGIKDDPGAVLPYVHVTSAMYWCSDNAHYNQLIDINEYPHDCSGEHLIDCAPYYNYGLFFDYNTNPVRYGAGSAFFVHCTGGEPYTAGCIAVSRDNMIKILRSVSDGARICIYSI